MHPNPRRTLPVLLILVLVVGGLWWRGRAAQAADGALRAAGTIEAERVTLAAEVAGRVREVRAAAGETVEAGQTLVVFDDALLQAQRAQAEAGLQAARGTQAAAEASLAAARANLDLLEAGPSDEQLAVAESAVARAEAAADAAQTALDALPAEARLGAQAQPLRQQWEIAQATLDSAEAQLAQLEAGARPQQLEASQAQVAAAQAQVEATGGQVAAAAAALQVLEVQLGRLSVAAPMTGVVLSRAVAPGEVAMPGSALLELADLSHLTLTVFVPEDRYGTITVGDEAAVTVDSFPGERFAATVERIADRAEFTPRNVGTAEGRRATVFAVHLRLDNPDGRLKPGMPADVVFDE